jgi:transposase-like protein
MEWTEAARKWQGILKEFDGQGSSRREFCEARGIKVSTFAYWRTRFRKSERERPGMVKVAGVGVPRAKIIIRVNDRLVIEVDGGISEQQLVGVLKAAAQT